MASDRIFKRIYREGMVEITEIWVDTRTGVHYLFHREGPAAGFTPLLGPDGKPVVQLEESYEEV